MANLNENSQSTTYVEKETVGHDVLAKNTDRRADERETEINFLEQKERKDENRATNSSLVGKTARPGLREASRNLSQNSSPKDAAVISDSDSTLNCMVSGDYVLQTTDTQCRDDGIEMVDFAASSPPGNNQTNEGSTESNNRQHVIDSSSNQQLAGSSGQSQKDKGWAWVIAIAGFLNIATTLGVYRSLGVVLVELIEVFEAPVTQSSLLFSSYGISFTVSALVLNTALAGVINERALVALGGLIGCLGFIITFFSTRIEHVTFGLGLCIGVAVQTATCSSHSLVSKYFDKRLALGTALIVTGASAGILIWPVLIQYLLDEYSIRGTALILAGVLLNCLVFAGLMRPFIASRPQRAMHLKDTNVDVGIEEENPCDQKETSSTGRGQGQPNFAYEDFGETGSVTKNIQIVSGKQDFQLCSVLTQIKQFVFLDQGQRNNPRMSSFIDLSLLKRPIFYPTLIYSFLIGAGPECLLNFYPPASRELGMSAYESAFLLSIVGMIGVVGRTPTGFLGDHVYDRYRIVVVGNAIFGGAVFAFPLLVTFWSQVAFAVVIGVTFGIPFVFKTALFKDFLGATHVSKVIGMDAFLIGIGVAGANPLMGWLKDSTGGYSASLYFTASVTLATCPLLIVIACLRGRESKTQHSYEINPTENHI